MVRNNRCYSFPPIASPSAKILILGSMPGQASLDANQYYAHPRNAFWSIMHAMFGVDIEWDYEKRCQTLTEHHVAVWDVLKACDRQGSLDSNIDDASIEANNFSDFFKHHPLITHLFFNGAKAEQTYHRHVQKHIESQWQSITSTRLASTSPAHAAVTLDKKIIQWQKVIATTL